MTWKAIETAPLHETVLLWNGDEVVTGSRDGTHCDWWSDYDMGDYESGLPMVPQPTHWMPLPAPPVDE